MISLLSPAKKLNYKPMIRTCDISEPKFATEAVNLVKTVSKLDVAQLSKLMSISQSLSELNKTRFLKFSASPGLDDVKQAAFTFAGDTYVGLDAVNLAPDTDSFFQRSVRIISGLYGLLRPFDMIQPHRLEMGSKLSNPRGKNLYEFWGTRLTEELEQLLKEHECKVIVNLASDEYFRAINTKTLTAKVITPKFFENKDGRKKMISFYAKKARGSMARFIISNKIDNPEELKNFDLDGYRLSVEESNGSTLVFER
ncbi:MAG: peroxide stress protein YaaA [Pseudomonadota bacterium]|nr:peroxide stress protein YaaA [Pseudomonadota bacterium]